MKKILSGLVISVLMMGNVAFAEDTFVSIGVNAWNNSWETRDISTGTVTAESDDSILMVGPTLQIRSGNVFAGLSVLSSADDYEFTASETASQRNYSAIDRTDLDLILGVMVHPRFGLFAGYKSIKSDRSVKTEAKNIFGTDSSTAAASVEWSGPGFGITANMPFEGTSFALYGNMGLMIMTYEESTGFSEDILGTSLELGAALGFAKHFNIKLAYKHQSLMGDTSDITDNFSGLTYGLSLIF